MRTDIHSPKNIVTTDYEFVTIRTREDDEMGTVGAVKDFNDHRAVTGGVFSNHKHGGNCMVCGSYMIDYAIFYHAKTNSYIRTGLDCTNHIEAGHDAAFKRVAQMRRAAQKHSKSVEKAKALLDDMGVLDQVETYFDTDHFGTKVVGYDQTLTPELAENYTSICCSIVGVTKDAPAYLIKRVQDKFYVVVDMVRNLVKYGNLSEKQKAFLKMLCDDLTNAKQEALEAVKAKEDATPAPEGKVTVKGVVASMKWVDSMYGSTHKMLVTVDGYKVWTTVPAKIQDVEVGNTVEFTATLERSKDDVSFAFAKRPSKAKIVG